MRDCWSRRRRAPAAIDIITDPQRRLTDEQAQALEALVARREKREPVSHILGVRGFWKIMLKVTPDVLTPRPDTESLLDVLLPKIPADHAVSVLDLGVGSGAILLAILSERPAARGLGVDVSAEAVAVARENAANLGLSSRVALLRGDWTAGWPARASMSSSPTRPMFRPGSLRISRRKSVTMSPGSRWTAALMGSTPIASSLRR